MITLLATLLIGVNAEINAIDIPLESIRALDMPGTASFDELIATKLNPEDGSPTKGSIALGRSLNRVRYSLAASKQGKDAMPGFVVPGTEMQAFGQAVVGLRKRQPSSGQLFENQELHVAFFAYSSAYQVVVESVQIAEKNINISYSFVPQYSVESKVQFALIPLGKLPVGQYQVNVEKLPIDQKFIDASFEEVSTEQVNRLVCKSFAFQVSSTPNFGQSVYVDEDIRNDVEDIPLHEIWALDMPKTKTIEKLNLKRLDVPLGHLQTGPIDMLVRMNKHRAEPAFIVEGIGQKALEAAHKQLPKGEKPRSTFTEGTELTLVFFSHGLGRSCHIQKITRTGNTFGITYHLFPSGTENITSHVALIPIGKLLAGEYRVRIDQVPLNKKLGIPPLVGVDTSLSACQPCSFSVEASKSKEP